MCYELTDLEWSVIKPFLPNKPRGVPRVNDRRRLKTLNSLRDANLWGRGSMLELPVVLDVVPDQFVRIDSRRVARVLQSGCR